MNKPKKQGHRKGKTVGSQMHHSTRSLGKLSTWGRMQGNNNLSKGIVMAYSEIPTMTETKLKEMVKPLCKGSVKMTRYADDLVICCGRKEDAERIKKALAKRLAKYNLKMNEEKTKLINFSRRKHSLGEKQETFDFLGFTFYLGKSRRGKAVIKVKTKGKAFRSKLKKANEWARDIRNRYTLNSIMKQAAAKLRGHIQYYGVSHNYATVNKFVLLIKRILFKWLNRRSHRKSFTWEQFQKYLDRVKFPEPKICHALF